MRSSFSLPPARVDSIVINELSSEKPVTALLHSANLPTSPSHHHLYNYWTLNERLRAKNEKLSKRQQSSCRLAFYSMWLFIFAGVMAIIIYRFIDDCPSTNTDRKYFLLKCLRHILFLAAICVSFLACSGIICGACRYFRSQPQPCLYHNEYELRVTPNYNVLPTLNTSHSCFCQTVSANDTTMLLSQQKSNHHDEHSNATVTSSVRNISPQRKIPPFTYDELPPSQSFTPPPLPIRPNGIVNFNSTKSKHRKSAFISSSTSTSSSPQSTLSATIISNIPNATTSNNPKHKSTLVFEDACPSTPTSYTTCVCGIDVWEKQQRPSMPSSLR